MKSSRKFKKNISFLLLSAGLASAQLALAADNEKDTTAQNTPAAEKKAEQKPASKVKSLQRVVVTAQHRKQDLQDVPVSVTAVKARDLAETGQRTYDLFNLVPNAATENPDGESRPRLYVRGLGTGDVSASTVFPVGVYADGVYLNSPTATGVALFDLERVEVLRGPQGTLYGKNTTGGAINYLSRLPDFNGPEGHLTLGLGNYSQQTLDAAFGGAITDTIAARAAFITETRDGFTKNLATNKYEGGIDKTAYRVQVLVKPSEDFDLLLKVHKRTYDDNGSNGSLPLGTYNPGTAISYTRPEGRYIENGVYNTGKIEHEGESLTINKHFGDYVLTSITAYDDISSNSIGGGGTNPLENNSRTKADTEWKQSSQEFRLTSPQESSLRWIAGVHFFKEDLFSDSIAARYQQSVAQLPAPLVAQSAAAPGYRDTQYEHDTKSSAAYGNLTYDFTKKFSVTGGLRWTQEEKELDISLLQYTQVNLKGGNFWDVSNLAPVAPATTLTANVDQNRQLEKTWKDWGWDLTPEYKFSDTFKTFFRYARGFRSGAINVGVQGNLDPVRIVEPEYVNSYELGFKSEWLDGELIANGNIFYNDYTDIQTNLLVPNPAGGITSALANGPKAEIKGAEFEFDALLTENLRGRLALAFLDSEYTEFINRNPITGEITGDNSGNTLVRAPKFTLGSSLDYTFPLDSGASIVAGVDARYRDREYYLVDRQDINVDGPLSQKAYSIINLRLTYRSPDQKIRVAGYVNNAADELYQVHGRPGSGGAGTYVITYGNPLTAGVSLTLKY